MMTIDAILLHRIRVATYNIISNMMGLFQYFEYLLGGSIVIIIITATPN